MSYHLLAAPDGAVAIMQLVSGASLSEAVRKFSEVNFQPAEVIPLDPASLPQDRTFRNAWVKSGATAVVDMPKAREVWRERLRRERKPLLAALDVEVSRAMVKGETAKVAELETERQRLRDAPARPEIDAAKTPDELKAIRA